ncbi:unnamed protein product, partial [Pylaiella littoralis]
GWVCANIEGVCRGTVSIFENERAGAGVLACWPRSHRRCSRGTSHAPQTQQTVSREGQPPTDSFASTMSQVQALRLNENPMVDASLAFFQDAMKNGMSEKQVTLQLQTVAVIYACQGVKRNGGKTDKVKREQAACVAFRDFAVPGFLKWLATVAEPPVELPSWLTR